jgi:23S rRNA (cytosine1962-C5)-methyltransferase
MQGTDKYSMFRNRLTKVAKHLGKWARKQQISCYRIYDDDMPEFPLAIDVYEDILHVAEYDRPHNLSPDEHADWLQESLVVLSEVLDVHPARIYLKFRQKQKGLQQYDRFSREGAEYIVRENGKRFIINPSDYLDAGLFLDHRNTRKRIGDMAAGKKVLNLFAYTGSFTVYAAAAQAAETLTIDLSNTYLHWALRNLQINGLDNPRHQFLQADVVEWLKTANQNYWDIIVLDPPTFSNSKRMSGTLDIQRDHSLMLRQTLRLLSNDGLLLFSTNSRKFKLDIGTLDAQVEEISAQTIPADFRNKKMHHCFILRRNA